MKEKIQKGWKCLWVIWKDTYIYIYRCWFLSVTESIEAENIPQTKWHNTNKIVKQGETTFFALSTTTRSFSGFNLLLFLIYKSVCLQNLSCPSATYQSASDTDTWRQHLSPHYILLLLALANSPKTPNLESVGPQSPIYPYNFIFF